ncbi:hypothetical protein [Holzapfeliella floricola]|uniref:hypothetical protein n=1 Tax=Holzapfeliella floricola TaxID=679249 RepID=UPI00070507F9|nr:hypothetical protein [Holzapfeliella floricola]
MKKIFYALLTSVAFMMSFYLVIRLLGYDVSTPTLIVGTLIIILWNLIYSYIRSKNKNQAE